MSRNHFTDDDMDLAEKRLKDSRIKPEFAHGQGGDLSESVFGGSIKDYAGADSADTKDSLGLGGPPRSSLFGGGGSGPFGGGGASGGGNPYGASGGGSPFGRSSSIAGSVYGAGGPDAAKESEKSLEDRIYDDSIKGLKKAVGFLGELMQAVRDMNHSDWADLGSTGLRVGIVGGIISFVLFLIGWNKALTFTLGFGYFVLCGFFLVLFYANEGDEVDASTLEDDDDTEGVDIFEDEEGEDDDEAGFEDLEGDFDDGVSALEDDFFGSLDDDDFEGFDDDLLSLSGGLESSKSDLGSSIDTVQYAGVYSRSMLYDFYKDMMRGFNTDFDKKEDLPLDDRDVVRYAAMVLKVCEILDMDEDDYPDVERVERTSMVDRVFITRPRKLSQAKFKEEFEKLHAYENYKLVSERFVELLALGTQWVITIYDERAKRVGVRDAMIKASKFYLDSSNKYPMAVGYNVHGDLHMLDLKGVESILVAGAPRSGKSWFVKAMLSQLVAFSSPKDVAFYLGDVKGSTSDFSSFRVPHVRSFMKDGNSILEMLRYVVSVEAPRRRALFAEGKNYINYWDYKKDHVDADLPMLYVVLDEMVSLSTELSDASKELYTEYRGLLSTIVTQLPNLGIRFIGVSHVFKNEYVPKTVTDVIKFKVSVGGDRDHVESTTGGKLDRPLTSAGDMAVLATEIERNVFYSRGLMLGESSDAIDTVFALQAKLWSKLEPDFSYEGDSEADGAGFKVSEG